ncbi:MAG: UDP-N-acetylmuramoyl-L-alanine--D-glutamate ligase [Fimbriimonadaceae bacterium]|nr:UDP-N-acetylmuramoyl-L-alanine--D-glutamate ligase [Fimbriimonadaceae bacterium]QYK55283.1 MAG: UDP-N-acetylmuramoyl-L-alanine--D-glutamate ligase [Fimbriimonadaceae bacterium]
MRVPKRIAVAGMGVSGLAVGRVAARLGSSPVVFDQKPADSPNVIEAVDQLVAEGVEAVTGWHGRLDGSEFDALVVSPGFPREHPAIRDMLAHGRPVWSEVEFGFRIAKAPVVAITGTNGKSATTVLTWTLLEASGTRAWLCGNIAGSGFQETTFTEAAAAAGADDVLVAEVSSYQLEWVEEFHPRAATVTNVTPDHMNRYNTFEDYLDTKLRILDRLGEGDAAVLNIDSADAHAQRVRERVAASGGTASIVTYSPSGTQVASGVTRVEGETLLLGDHVLSRGELPLLGHHSVANVLCAWELASRVGNPNEASVDALRSFRGLSHRLERVGERGGVLVVNNSMCTNPAAVVASSQSLGRRQHLLMGGDAKKLDYAPVRDYLAGSPHKVYVFGPEAEQTNANLGGRWQVFARLEDAFEAAVAAAVPGEAVMLAPGCASSEPYANFKERGEAFREMAVRWLGS